MRALQQITHLALCAGFLVAPLSASMRDDRRDCQNSCFKSTLCDIKHLIEDLSACGQSISIGQEDIGTTGYVIDKPGNYCLKEDVVFDPVTPAGSSTLSITGTTGSGAQNIVAVSGGVVRGITVVDGGSDYISAPTVTIDDPYGAGATAQAYVDQFGHVVSIVLTNGGNFSYYAPTATITGLGTGATATVQTDGFGDITGFTITNPGTGYPAPVVTINGTGFGATVGGIAVDASGEIQGFTIATGGSGYVDTVLAAITIKASGVRLAFNGNRLYQAGVDGQGNVSSSQRPFVCGIVIPDIIPDADVNDVGLESIYIEGGQGVIDGFSEWGIYVFGHVADVSISNLTIINCGKLASTANRPFPNYYPTGLPQGRWFDNTPPSLGLVPFGVGALSLGESDWYGMGPYFFTQRSFVAQNRVNSCEINNVSCLNNYYLGINASNTTDMYIANSHFDNVYTDDPNLGPACGQFGGADMTYENPSILNLTVENSTFNGASNIGDGVTEITANGFGADGLYCTHMQNFSFRNCQFNNASCTFPGGEVLGVGAESLTSGLFEDCTMNNISNLGAIYGFGMTGENYFGDAGQTMSPRNVSFIRCQASNVLCNAPFQLGATQATGFFAGNSKNIYFEDCVASDITCTCPGYTNLAAVGFYIEDGQEAPPDAYEADNFLFRGCIAQRVMCTEGGNGIGFRLAPQQGAGNVLRTIALEDCIAEGCMSMPNPTVSGTTQGVGVGFMFESNNETDVSYPISFTNCKALHNKGVPSIYVSVNHDTFYTAGFFETGVNPGLPASVHTYYGCEATDNVYGFLFRNDQRCVIRNCRADLNVADDGVTGEGFTDLGLCSLIITASVNTDFATTVSFVIASVTTPLSPLSGAYNGDVLSFPNPNSEAYPQQAVIGNYSGAPDYLITLAEPLDYPPFAGDEVVISTYGTPELPVQSFSLFESNRAFANGAGYTHFGQNGNYNVIYGSGLEADFVPTLTGNLTHKTAIGGSFFPEANFIAHNLSITIA